MTKLLSKNSKMTKTSNDQYSVFNWTLPAIQTCPSAGQCKKGCFATKGAYIWSGVKAKHQANLAATKADNFIGLMSAEISVKLKTATRQKKQLVIRIHDAGDFYSPQYLMKWFSIIDAFPSVQFYCYTKSVALFKKVNAIPSNLLVNFSFGGLLDSLIDTNTDRHVHIFQNEADLIAAGYQRNDSDDSLAFDSSVKKIGLVARWGIGSTFDPSRGIGTTFKNEENNCKVA